MQTTRRLDALLNDTSNRGYRMGSEEEFVRDHQGFVRSIAIKVMTQLDLRVEVDDLVAFGNRGLLEAKMRYDASRGIQFNTFAYYRIRGAMIDGVRQMAYLPARIHKLRTAAEATDRIAESAAETRAASPESRSDAGATVKALDDALGRATAAFIMSVVGQGEDDAPETPEDAYLAAEQRVRVTAALSKLPEREAALVKGFYFEGRQFDDVAKELGISKSWASRLHTKALDILRTAMEAE